MWKSSYYYFLEKKVKSYKVQQPLPKQEMNHDEFYENTWEI